MQRRAAYFGCIAAPDDSCEARAPAEPPSSSWPASSAPPRWSRARIGVAGRRRNSGGSTKGGRTGHQTRPIAGAGGRQIHEGLWGKCQRGWCWDVAQPALMCILTELGPVSGRAGRKGRFELTSATRNPEHFTALNQILDGALNLCSFHQHQCPLSTSI